MILRCLLAIGLLVGCVLTPAHADSKTITVEPGLIEIRLDLSPERDLEIEWEPRQPVNLQYRTYENEAVCVFYATSGQLVLQSDVIDWEGRKREKTNWIVNIGPPPPNPPGPNPPGPDPPPPPPPPPPDVEVPNALGIGLEVYNAARAINQPVNAKALAVDFARIAQSLHEGRLLIDGATVAAATAIDKLPAEWSQFDAKLAALLAIAIEKHGAGQLRFRDYFHEAALALEVAAK